MISNSSKYALKAVLYLGLNSNENNKIMAKEIAGPVNAPLPYISKLLQELARKGLISSQKGPKGGFYLSEENRKKNLMDVVSTIDGELRIHTCVLDLERCNHERPCPLHDAVFPTKSVMIKYFTEETIGTFSEKYESAKTYFDN